MERQGGEILGEAELSIYTVYVADMDFKIV